MDISSLAVLIRPAVASLSPLILAARFHRGEAWDAEGGEFLDELVAEGGLEVHGEDVEVCVFEFA